MVEHVKSESLHQEHVVHTKAFKLASLHDSPVDVMKG